MVTKNMLRRRARRCQGQLPAVAVERDSEAIAGHIRRSALWTKLRVLHSYVNSLPGEIITRATISAARAAGVRVLVPFVEPSGPPMRHAEIDSLSQLQTGHWGLQQPATPAFVTDLSIVDVVLVPGLLFDRRGFRIGQGGGFYDRFLAALPARTISAGLTFDDCLIDRIPAEDHDVPVHLVITPSGIFHAQSQRTTT